MLIRESHGDHNVDALGMPGGKLLSKIQVLRGKRAEVELDLPEFLAPAKRLENGGAKGGDGRSNPHKKEIFFPMKVERKPVPEGAFEGNLVPRLGGEQALRHTLSFFDEDFGKPCFIGRGRDRKIGPLFTLPKDFDELPLDKR